MCSLICLCFWVETATIPISSYKQYAVNMQTVNTLAIHALTANTKHIQYTHWSACSNTFILYILKGLENKMLLKSTKDVNVGSVLTVGSGNSQGFTGTAAVIFKPVFLVC